MIDNIYKRQAAIITDTMCRTMKDMHDIDNIMILFDTEEQRDEYCSFDICKYILPFSGVVETIHPAHLTSLSEFIERFPNLRMMARNEKVLNYIAETYVNGYSMQMHAVEGSREVMLMEKVIHACRGIVAILNEDLLHPDFPEELLAMHDSDDEFTQNDYAEMIRVIRARIQCGSEYDAEIVGDITKAASNPTIQELLESDFLNAVDKYKEESEANHMSGINEDDVSEEDVYDE